MSRSNPTALKLDVALLRPGLRLAVGVSGGADSVALLRALSERSREFGLVLHVAHLHHGLRGDEADADLQFVRDLAARLELPFHEERVDTAAEAKAQGQTIEEAARHLRYRWFRELMARRVVDAVATAHTSDDQAETVLAKFLRGAWTEGLSGIHPVVTFPEGRIVRPLLSVTRAQVEAYLRELGQDWREDSTNRHLTFTRNRIRHELLPLLGTWNPKMREHLAQMAELARDEETWWDAEVARIVPQVILPGRPVRGGGRAAAEGVAFDLARLTEQPLALQRRLIRHATEQLGFKADFEGTEALRKLASEGRAGQRCELANGLRGERTHRELRLSIQPVATPKGGEAAREFPESTFSVPGEVVAPAFNLRIRIESKGSATGSTATLRVWKAGDRVQLRHSGGPRKVKEVLERLKVSGTARAGWPVVEVAGKIVWMKGVAVEPEPGLEIVSEPLEPGETSRA